MFPGDGNPPRRDVLPPSTKRLARVGWRGRGFQTSEKGMLARPITHNSIPYVHSFYRGRKPWARVEEGHEHEPDAAV